MPGRVMTPAEALEAEMEAVLPAPSLRRVALAAVLAMVLGAGGLVGWAAATSLERAVMATGALVAEGKRKTVTLLEPGLLHALVVREGEQVAAGQVLVQLDITQAEAAAKQMRALYWGLAARAARLRAEQAERRDWLLPQGAAAAAADPAIGAVLEAERRLFGARWAAFDGSIELQRTRIAQLQEQRGGLVAQRTAAVTQLHTIRQELADVNQLLTRGLATRPRQLALLRSEAELLGNLGQLQAQEAQTREQSAQAQAEMANLSLNRQQDIARELQDAQTQLADAEQRLRSATDILTRREVTAPEAGTVTDIRFFTPGSSIGAGVPLLDLVPAGDRLIVEARVAPIDVEQVRVGQPARLRLAAYRSHELPLLDGQVTYVSADRQTDEQGSTYYLARVEMVPHGVEGVTLAAGMPVDAYLLGERRSALDYILRPLRDSLRRSLRD